MRPERFRRRLGIALCSAGATGPKFLGPAAAVLPPGRRTDTILDFAGWLGDADAATLAGHLRDLRSGGQGFDLMFTARDGRQVRAIGWSLGAGLAKRVSPKLS